jgi:peptide/nickel transport system substrate-binding protein
LPILTPAQLDNTNQQQFIKFMYLPLFWMGDGKKPYAVDYKRSIAQPPVWSGGGKVVTIHMNKYVWSNGTPVTAQDVAFWEQLIVANKTSWGGYVPGEYPDNVVSTTVLNNYTIRFTLTKAYNHSWLIDNELSQITPMPLTWDKTSTSGPVGSAANTTTGAKAVFTYLNGQAEDLTTYATNPLWRVVDGPWLLKSFETTGYSVYTRNPHFSGAQPKITEFIEEPFTSYAAEFNAILAPNGPDVGYLPVSDVPALGEAKSAGYTLSPWVDWNYNFIGLNRDNPTAGPIFEQLYVRQALERVMDQPTMVKDAYGGYASQIFGPIPPLPKNTLDTVTSNPYPFNVKDARSLLKQHGWSEKGGVQTCAKPGTAANECGPGVKAGAKLNFTLVLASEDPPLLTAMEDYKTDAASAGIDITLTQLPVLTIYGDMAPCTGASCPTWQLGTWGVGWTYFPDYYPTGDEIFETGATGNFGDYNNATNNANILATELATVSQTQGSLNTYQKYLAKQLPVLWTPNADYQLTLVKNGLHGVLPQSPVLMIEPDTWYW